MNLFEALNELNSLCEAKSQYSTERGTQINLADCRAIKTDVTDVRGELETNYCVDYYPVNSDTPILTRVQVRIIITRDTAKGKQFLARKFRYGFQLPGGGYDANKDDGSIINTAKRETLEEFNIVLKNVKDTDVTNWRYREDNWVTDHVENPADRWAGYYSYYVTGEYDTEGDNNIPEEINNFKWYPIADLFKTNDTAYKQAAATLTEDWGSGEHGEQDYTIPGAISYCCESPAKLAMILQSGLIKASIMPETHETDRAPRKNGKGKGKLKEYPYVSFSRQLYSHAYRRPVKWSFGLLLDESELEARGYEFTDRDHEYNQLQFSAIFKGEDGRYMTQTTMFGFVEISEEIYNILLKGFIAKGAIKSEQNKGNTSLVKAKYGDLTRERSWDMLDRQVTDKTVATANRLLKNANFGTKTTFAGSSYYMAQYSVSISDFSKADQKIILDYLLDNTYYNEGERRVWCKHGEDGVHFDTNCVYGIIMPSAIEPVIDEITESDMTEALELSSAQYDAMEYICEYVVENNLDLFIHNAADEYHLKELDVDRAFRTKGIR